MSHITHTHVTLAHGNGGRLMRQLIEEVFAAELENPVLDTQADATTLPAMDGELMMTVDGFTVSPLEFPGGSIGSLAIHGTVNDLAVSGAVPRFLSLSAIIEEGLEFDTLRRIVGDMAEAARTANVQIVCGDTKVVPRGEGSGVYLTTTGIGVREQGLQLGLDSIQDGDRILVSGPVGDHGAAIMLAREQFGLKGDLQSDANNVLDLCQSLYGLSGLRFMRDPTRGGLATVLHEIQHATDLGIRIQQEHIPVHETVQSVCEILGYDPLFMACEGRVVAVIAEEQADEALSRWHNIKNGQEARSIGRITAGVSRVVLETELGGERILEELEDDPLPRIC
jgi:hydrogenase expression/formation protein HypE